MLESLDHRPTWDAAVWAIATVLATSIGVALGRPSLGVAVVGRTAGFGASVGVALAERVASDRERLLPGRPTAAMIDTHFRGTLVNQGKRLIAWLVALAAVAAAGLAYYGLSL